ncbi:FtsX-like permease family protein [Planomonospora sp. ID67723]|uniref:FtsX-like permease family protein n=1 Tax=Planomonospora sp. ID67723 TaxID=2738134 RepID=UPI0018C3AFEC|nr:FtsX-like permease family protein [Planomonospora sp. ID67723]MBG0832296.1 FtsX-like permease family protein [Planomonospora sp. ID67723]
MSAGGRGRPADPAGDRPVDAGEGERPPAAGRSPLAALLAALRISRRDVWRARGRSALIIVMVALPVMFFSGTVTWIATHDIDSREALTWEMGAADAKLRARLGDAVRQSADGELWFDEDGDSREGDRAEELSQQQVASFFGPGSRAVRVRGLWTGYGGPRGYREGEVVEIDLHDPITAGMYRLVSGRLPRTAGEVATSPSLAVAAGSSLTLDQVATPVTVVGVVEPQRHPAQPQIVAAPGTVPTGGGQGSGTEWLVDTPAPVSWQQVRALNRQGLVVSSRAVINDPPPPGGMEDPAPRDPQGFQTAVTAVLGVAMVVLEVALLAGPAFAVGIRRRRRELALLAAQGGSARHLRWIVLADGLTLGLTASVLGSVLGVGVVAALAPSIHRGPFDLPLGQVALVTLLGVVSSLLAALVPAAQAARTDAATALAGRHGPVRDRKGWPVAGLVLAAAGCAVAASPVWSDARGEQFTGRVELLAGAALGQFGLVLLTPWLVRAAAGLAVRLPLPFRLAARDAARNRGRTAPAVAAVLAASAAFTAVAVIGSSRLAQDREGYLPSYVHGSTAVSARPSDPRAWAEVKRVVTAALPGVPLIEAGTVVTREDSFANVSVVNLACERHCIYAEGRFGELPVGGVDLLRHLLRGPDPAAEAAFAEGKAVVFDPAAIRDGSLVFTIGDSEKPRPRTVPAVLVRPRSPLPVTGVLPVAAVTRLGLQVRYDHLIADPAVLRASPETTERLNSAVTAVGFSAGAYAELGFTGDETATLLVLAAAAALLVLGGTFAATGLAAAEARADRATLAAVGAPARTQRLLVAGQAAFIAGLGVVTGTAAGMVPGVADAVASSRRAASVIMQGSGGHHYRASGVLVDVPWPVLGAMVVGLPLLAGLVAALFTRTRVVLTRRMT